MARVILKTPRYTPAAALLGDLTWFDLKDIHNKLKVTFFSRLKHMGLQRWPNLMLNVLFIVSRDIVSYLGWKWLKSINNILYDNELMDKCNEHPHNETLLYTIFSNHDDMSIQNWYK